jgi:glycerophosphoryl diester phosphodiesterase
MFTYSTGPKPFIWGHRGVPSEAVENTLASFALAKTYELNGFEFDVQFSRDGVPFVFHDDTLARLAGIEQTATDLAWSELAPLVLKDPARPTLPAAHLASLQEVLEHVPEQLMINLELKANPGVTRAQLQFVWDLLEQYHLTGRTVVSSFYHEFLEELAEIAHSVNLAALWVQVPSESAVRQMARLTRIMHIPWQLIRADAVQNLHGQGCEVGVWGIAGVEDLHQCYAQAVDAIFIDDPTWLRALPIDSQTRRSTNGGQQ